MSANFDMLVENLGLGPETLQDKGQPVAVTGISKKDSTDIKRKLIKISKALDAVRRLNSRGELSNLELNDWVDQKLDLILFELSDINGWVKHNKST